MTQAQATLPAFVGSSEEQALGHQVFEVLVGLGVAYARSALIRQTTGNLATFLSQAGKVILPEQVDAVVRQNPDVFERQQHGDDVLVATTKQGRSHANAVDSSHTFRDRLYEPERPLSVDDINNVVTLIKPIITVVEPVQISSYWRVGRTPSLDVPDSEALPVPETSEAAFTEATPVAEFVSPVLVQDVGVMSPAATVSPKAPAPAKAPATIPSTAIVLSDGTVVDLRLPADQLLAQQGAALQAEVRAALDDDPLKRVVGFGDYFYAAEALRPFGKGDLRRIRDFVIEQGEPQADATIMADLYRERPGSPNFDLACFGLDYRLAREKDFEFVGVPGVNLWSAKGLPAIGTKRVKASDIGQLYSFLQDGYEDPEEAIEGLVQHPLTVWEWEYGILPLNSAFQSLFPHPLLNDQRTAVIRIESPQHYSFYMCELRFPTGTRGGWLWGLEEFFHEYLVPGVTVNLAATEDPTVFTLQYDEAQGTEVKLLHLDEKRNRYAYMSVTYYARVDEKLLPTQANYNKLRNLKPLPMGERKKAEVVIAHVFETVGEQLGSKEEPLYWLQFNELWMAVNVLRPMSHAYLEHLLNGDDVFYADETTVGAYYYKPVPTAVEVTEEEDTSVLTYDEDED